MSSARLVACNFIFEIWWSSRPADVLKVLSVSPAM